MFWKIKMPQETKLLRASNIITRKHYNTGKRRNGMGNREKIAQSINAHSVNVISRKALMKDIADKLSEDEKIGMIKSATIASAEMMNKEAKILRGALYNLLVMDSINVVLGASSESEKERIISKMMKDDMFCEDFVKSVEKIVGRG